MSTQWSACIQESESRIRKYTSIRPKTSRNGPDPTIDPNTGRVALVETSDSGKARGSGVYDGKHVGCNGDSGDRR